MRVCVCVCACVYVCVCECVCMCMNVCVSQGKRVFLIFHFLKQIAVHTESEDV